MPRGPTYIVIVTDLDIISYTTIQSTDMLLSFSVKKALLINITSVARGYRRIGLAHQMTQVVLEEAGRRQFPLVVSESTSPYTQKSKIQRFSFEPVREFIYKESYSGYNSIPEKLIYTKAVVLAKRLHIR